MNATKSVQQLAQSALEVFNQHGFASRYWTSDAGYTICCRCGHEILLGQMPEVLVSKPDEMVQLQEKDSLTPVEESRLTELFSAYDIRLKKEREKSDEAFAKRMRQAMNTHVLVQFESAFQQVGSLTPQAQFKVGE